MMSHFKLNIITLIILYFIVSVYSYSHYISAFESFDFAVLREPFMNVNNGRQEEDATSMF